MPFGCAWTGNTTYLCPHAYRSSGSSCTTFLSTRFRRYSCWHSKGSTSTCPLTPYTCPTGGRGSTNSTSRNSMGSPESYGTGRYSSGSTPRTASTP